jgi:hypothetical protein
MGAVGDAKRRVAPSALEAILGIAWCMAEASDAKRMAASSQL